jgi:hypothetical protein
MSTQQPLSRRRFAGTGETAVGGAITGLACPPLACCGYDATMGIGVLNDSPVKTPKDLEGRRMASTVTSGRISVPAGLRRACRVRPVESLDRPGRQQSARPASAGVAQDFETMTDLVMNYIARENDERPPAARVISNRFVGGLHLSEGEWQGARKSAREFRACMTRRIWRDRLPTPDWHVDCVVTGGEGVVHACRRE